MAARLPRPVMQSAPVHFAGVDLAWGQKRPTGLAVLDGSGRLLHVSAVRTDEEIVGILSPFVEGDCLVTFDALLIVRNATGNRPTEAALNRDFGRFETGAPPWNTARPEFSGTPRRWTSARPSRPWSKAARAAPAAAAKRAGSPRPIRARVPGAVEPERIGVADYGLPVALEVQGRLPPAAVHVAPQRRLGYRVAGIGLVPVRRTLADHLRCVASAPRRLAGDARPLDNHDHASILGEGGRRVDAGTCRGAPDCGCPVGITLRSLGMLGCGRVTGLR